MPVSDSFLAFVLDQLSSCGPITSKRMFGGVGLYAGDVFFAVMMDDTIYLKVDDTTRASYEAAGSRAFNPYPTRPDGGVSTSYYEVPLAVLEDADDFTVWARESIRVAARTPNARSKGTRARTRRTKNPRTKNPRTKNP